MNAECYPACNLIKKTSIVLGAFICALVIFKFLNGQSASYYPIFFVGAAFPLVLRKNIKPIPLFLIVLAAVYPAMFISSLL
jgi:hypothetical protein